MAFAVSMQPNARTDASSVDTVIVGGGQAGLALSRLLTDTRHDHVVLERGRVGERWRSERWDSLALLTPNWANRLPHDGEPANPDAMTRAPRSSPGWSVTPGRSAPRCASTRP